MEKWTQLVSDGIVNNNYFVSDLGQIKNKYGKILSQKTDSQNYKAVQLPKNYKLPIHRAVFESFNPNIKKRKKWVIDHIDNNKKNNSLGNLQYITARQNTSKDKNRNLPTGVSLTTEKNRNKKYYADIRINGKKKNLGRYYTQTEARLAYLKALISINEFFMEDLETIYDEATF